ncbi:hypothetical protein OH76DRAFT_680099 [Lentinus brumalis]|uniref:Uncharacterized protein n=1 Tax=Lentinus brumalis TaxID=2498619 RepID=A0A371D6K5_9APHY|nr:hypothetical protein OH76DRAFT_680099 [Polyporus brumalis]
MSSGALSNERKSSRTTCHPSGQCTQFFAVLPSVTNNSNNLQCAPKGTLFEASAAAPGIRSTMRLTKTPSVSRHQELYMHAFHARTLLGRHLPALQANKHLSRPTLWFPRLPYAALQGLSAQPLPPTPCRLHQRPTMLLGSRGKASMTRTSLLTISLLDMICRHRAFPSGEEKRV